MATKPDVLLTGDLGFNKQVIDVKQDGFTIDFSNAILHSEVYPKPKNAIPLVINLNGHDDIILRGGTVIRHDDPDTTWRQSYKPGADYIHSSGLTLNKGDGSVTIDGLRVHNTHDAIVVSTDPKGERYVTIRHVYATHIRDDAIENDGMKSIVVEDCLFDGVFVGFSAVNGGSAKPGNPDPVVTIRDTLVRMENMAGDPTRSTTDDGRGHGRLFKWWDGRAPELVLENNIFVVEDRDAWDDSVNKKIVHSENNIMIWMGEGEFRGKLPAGFTLIEGDDKAFREARDAWLERHGYDAKGSLKDNLHAPILEGVKPEPEPEPAPEPDVLLTGDLGFDRQVINANHDGFTVDLSGTTLHSTVYPKSNNATPLRVNLNGHDNVIVRGGTIIRHDDPDTTWSQSYNGLGDHPHSSGLRLNEGDGSVTVDGLRLHNTHDGIVIAQKMSDEKYVTVRHVYATHIRDDAVENDGMKNVLVEDSLFDGVFVGFSARTNSTGKPGNDDPVVTIRDTLVRMENMAGDPTVSTTEDGWGHGRLFKWDARAPELVLENNIFVVEDRDAWDDTVNKKIVHSENNIMIWMGEGEFRGKLPAGFTLIEGDDRAFREARDAWLERHGYDPKGSLKDNLHAPILEGMKPEPAPEPDLGLVANWMLDADLNGKQQKVVIDHDASLELDQGTVALTFTADRVSGVQSLFSKDSLGFDHGGHLSIWLKDGQVVARLQSDSQSYQLSSDPGVIKAGAASQVAVSFGDEGFRLYVGEELVDQSHYTGGIAHNSEPVVLGASTQRSSDGKADNLRDFFKGTISKVDVYDKQLTLSEPEPAPEPDLGLVANWMLDADLNGKQQKVVINHDASLELDQGTVALTFTADRVSGVQSLFSKDSLGFDDGGHLSIWLKNGQVVARLQSDNQSYQLSSDPGVIKAGAASQVAVSFGDEGFRLYVGEALVDQSHYTGGMAHNSEPVVLGASTQRSSDGKADNLRDFFKGTISELTVYDEQFNANLELTADHHFLA